MSSDFGTLVLSGVENGSRRGRRLRRLVVLAYEEQRNRAPIDHEFRDKPEKPALEAPLLPRADDDEIVAPSRFVDGGDRRLFVAHELHAHRGAVPRSFFGESLIDLLLRAESLSVVS